MKQPSESLDFKGGFILIWRSNSTYGKRLLVHFRSFLGKAESDFLAHTYPSIHKERSVVHDMKKREWNDCETKRDCSCKCQPPFVCPPSLNLPGTIRIEKVDTTTGTPVSGAVFLVTDSTGRSKLAFSNERGRVAVQVPAGRTYTIREVAAPNGYIPNPLTYVATVRRNREVYVNGVLTPILSIGNTPVGAAPGSLPVLLLATFTNTPIADGTFTLTGGNQVLTVTTDENGIGLFTNIPAGTYTLAQTGAPFGYNIDTQTYQVIVDTDGLVSINGVQVPATGFIITNDLTIIFLAIRNLLSFGGTASNATFRLVAFDGSYDESISAGTTGTVTFAGLSPGRYALSQPIAPVLARRRNDIVFVTVTEDDRVLVEDGDFTNRFYIYVNEALI